MCVFSVQDKIESIMQTLQLWERCVESNRNDCFSNLHNLLIENQLKLDQNTKTNITAHLRVLSATSREYFPVLSDSNNWIRNPFDESIIFSSQGLATEDTEKLIEISSGYELKLRFKSLCLINFWLSVRKSTLCWQERPLQRYNFQLPLWKIFPSYANL
jgi:hypothetical protein